MAGKKLYRIIICFLLCLFSIEFPIIEANEEAGYVYDELNVIVTINEEKEYHVEEHMVIDFQKEMHGIIRDIPKESQVEDVRRNQRCKSRRNALSYTAKLRSYAGNDWGS